MQMMMNIVMQVIAQNGTSSIEDASQMIADARAAALAMFPDKELAYDLIWRRASAIDARTLSTDVVVGAQVGGSQGMRTGPSSGVLTGAASANGLCRCAAQP